MARKAKHPLVQLGDRVKYELENDPPRLARVLLGSSQPDATVLGKQGYADYVRRHWGDGEHWRQAEAARDPDGFLAAFRELGGVVPGEEGHSRTVTASDGTTAIKQPDGTLKTIPNVKKRPLGVDIEHPSTRG